MLKLSLGTNGALDFFNWDFSKDFRPQIWDAEKPALNRGDKVFHFQLTDALQLDPIGCQRGIGKTIGSHRMSTRDQTDNETCSTIFLLNIYKIFQEDLYVSRGVALHSAGQCC